MECPTGDQKLYKVFDGSKRKRARMKDLKECNSVATSETISMCQVNNGRAASGKASLQDLPAQAIDGMPDGDTNRKNSRRGSGTSIAMSRSPRSPREDRRQSRSPLPHRHRRSTREGKSLALNAGLASSPRSATPHEGEDMNETLPQDPDSFIYDFLEDAIKRDKKKHRHSHSRRRHEERPRDSPRERDLSGTREHHRRHRRHHESREHDKPPRGGSHSPAINQEVLLETFAKICAHMNEKNAPAAPRPATRTHSHKSLQCEVASRHNYSEERHTVNAVKQRSFEKMHEIERPSRQEVYHKQSREKIPPDWLTYDRASKTASKTDIERARQADGRYREYPPETVPTRTYLNPRDRPPYPDYDRERRYEEDRRQFEQKTSRSFEVRRDYDDERCKTSTRSESRRFDQKYYERPREPDRPKERSRRQVERERSDRNSVVSRDELRERDKYSERERDSGLSVADGEISTVSGRSNYLRVVKQEITEQREAMDKMMKLWKELMRCFKGTTQPQNKDKPSNDPADNMRESAAAQLRLWRECMQRYETVARDVGDTDARLMEEINKQRSEMAEMATMWQECLQRYRDMSNDFNNLKKKLATPPESPTRMAVPPPLGCAEGEGSVATPQYRIPASYSQMASISNPGYGCAGSVLRGRASAPPGLSGPPAWWWGGGPDSPRRRSSPDSRGSRDRDRDRDRERDRHRHKDARDERYKGKSSKPSGARSEHRHRKR